MKKRIHPITMPKWGIEMQEGTINAWHASVGSTVKKGDPLLDVETKKIVNTVESPIDGTLRRTMVDTGETHPVGTLLGLFAIDEVGEGELDEFVAQFKAADTSFEPAGSSTAAETPAAAGSSAATASADATVATGADEVRVSPIARRVAESLGVDVSLVKGTGRNGRVSKEDVEAFARDQGLLSAAPTGSAAGSAAGTAAAAGSDAYGRPRENMGGYFGDIDATPQHIASKAIWNLAEKYLQLSTGALDKIYGMIVSSLGTGRALAFNNTIKTIDSPNGQGMRIQPKYRWGIETWFPKSVVLILSDDFTFTTLTAVGGVHTPLTILQPQSVAPQV